MNDHLGESLSALIDGSLDDASRASAEAHLRACAACRHEADALRATLADLEALPRPVLSETDAARVRAQLRRSRRIPDGVWVKAGAVAAAVVLVAGGGLLLSRSGDGTNVTAAGADAAPAIVQDLDYDDTTARALLTQPAATAESLTTAGMPQGTEATMASAPADTRRGPAEGGTGLAAIPDIDHSAKIAECERTIPFDEGVAERLHRVVARFQGEPAYLLTYRVPKNDPTHLELWVLAIEDCGVRYFAERKL